MRASIGRAIAQRAATTARAGAAAQSLTHRAAATTAAAAPQRLFSFYTAAAAVAAPRSHITSLRSKCACSACNTSSAASLSRYSSLSSVAPTAAAAAGARSFATQSSSPPKTPASAAATPRAPAFPSSTLAPAQTRIPSFNAVMKRFNLLVHPDLFGSTPTHAHANQVSLQQLNSLLSTLKTRDSKEMYPPKQVLQLVFHVKKRRGDEKWAEYVRTHDLRMHLAGKCAPVAGRAASPAGPNNHGARRRPAPRAPPRGVSALPPRGTHVLENEFHVVPVIVSTNGGHCKNHVQEQLASLFYRCGLPHKFEWDDEYWNMGGARAREEKEEFEEEEGEESK